jgi:hypothetical protein
LDIQAKCAGCSQKLQWFWCVESKKEKEKEASHISSMVNRKKKKAEQT